MNRPAIFFVLLSLIFCSPQTVKQAISQDGNVSHISYTEQELVSFLDSIGSLNPDSWTKELSFLVDSTLESQVNLNRKLGTAELDKLENAIENNEIGLDFAKQIFPEVALDTTYTSYFTDGYLPIKRYQFTKELNEFAVLVGYEGSWENDIYFFKGNTIIAKHHIYYRYGFYPSHFKNENNETVVYYTVCYGSGSGIWWHQYNFYTYKGNSLLPILTVPQNINLQFPWGLRAYWIESEVTEQIPLQLKLTYSNHFFGTEEYVELINDSTVVTYSITRQNGRYVPDFSDTKMNQNKLLTYHIAENDLLFVNAHYNLLREGLNGKQRQTILKYLGELKNWINKK